MTETPTAPAPDPLAKALLGGDKPADKPSPKTEPAPQPDRDPSIPAMADRPAAGSGFDWAFGNAPESSQDAPDTPGGSEDKPKPAKAAPEGKDGPQSAAQAIDAVIEARIPLVPDFLAGESKEKIDQWQGLREVARKASHENSALQLLVEQLRSGAKGDDSGDKLPESEAVTQLQARISELEPAAKRWQEEEARNQIGDSVAFKQRFDAPRAAVLRELTAAGKKAGLDDPAAAAEEFLKLDSEYDQGEWIAENFDDETGRPAKFFQSKGGEFRKLTAEASAELAGPDPLARVRDYLEYESAFQTKFAAKMSGDIQGQFQAALPRVRDQLLSESGDPLFFKTETGVKTLSDLANRLSEGNGIGPDEIILALANQPRADAYRTLATRFASRIEDLEGQLRKVGALDPGNRQFDNPNPAPPGSDAPSNMPQIGSGRTQPLISREQLAKAGLG